MNPSTYVDKNGLIHFKSKNDELYATKQELTTKSSVQIIGTQSITITIDDESII